jgi:hypothetical protein
VLASKKAEAKADPEYSAGVAAALVRLAAGRPAGHDRQSTGGLKNDTNGACNR